LKKVRGQRVKFVIRFAKEGSSTSGVRCEKENKGRGTLLGRRGKEQNEKKKRGLFKEKLTKRIGFDVSFKAVGPHRGRPTSREQKGFHREKKKFLELGKERTGSGRDLKAGLPKTPQKRRGGLISLGGRSASSLKRSGNVKGRKTQPKED